MKTSTQSGVKTFSLILLIILHLSISDLLGQTKQFVLGDSIAKVTATDKYNSDASNRMTSSSPAYTYYYENFDIDNGGWTPVSSVNDSWVWVNSFPTNELNEGGFWRNNSFNYYRNNANIAIESPTMNFSGLTSIRVSLDVKYKVENAYDGMRILYSINGGAYTILGASGQGTHWYESNVVALGSDGWNGDGHIDNPSFNPHSQFTSARLDLDDATFAGQSNVKFKIEFKSDGSAVHDGVAFDNFRIEADPTSALSDASIAPADITSNLRLWLKMNAGVSATDGDDLTLWEDQAYDNSLDKEDATAADYLAPTYRDHSDRNINYNPVADFDHNNREYMNGKGGFYSQDYFAVFRSDDDVDTQTGSMSPGRQFAIGGRFSERSFHEDPTGLGLGSTSGRYSNEVLSHTIDSYPNGADAEPDADSYGRAYTSSTDVHNHVMIVNVKTNAAGTATEIYKNGKRVDNTTGVSGNGSELNFVEFYNLPYLIGSGRSGMAGRTTSQLNGMLSEIVSYDSPNSTTNQQKIHTYLGIKYGVTLQSSGSALTDYRLNDVDYIDADGSLIWDTSANSGHNYDVAGIGRDDKSQLNQKQSMSQNIETDGTGLISGFLTMGLTEIYGTNNENISANSTTLDDQEFLVWGNNNADLNGSPINVTVDMSSGISGSGAPTTEVSFTAIPRIWKVIETGGDVPSVQVSIPTNVVRTATPPDGRYLMFISSTGVFDPTADYRVMTETDGYLYAEYDFDGTEYITFGWAPEREFERSIYFNPSNGDFMDVGDNLDLNPSGFTISTWINRDSADSGVKTIVSKRDASFTEGYELNIWDNNRIQFRWRNGSFNNLVTTTQIPDNEWHHVAVVHNGSTLSLYIDGVLDTQSNKAVPNSTSQSFIIGAAGKTSTTQFFRGNIDEVRVWDTNLTVDQLRFIMNQEIANNSNFVAGSYFLERGITPTKNETSSLPWSDLAGYYPMSVYTYTNTRDESGNGNTAALRNLRTVDWQTAPLPYMTTANGDWDKNPAWLNGEVQATPGTQSIVDSDVTVDWNIVHSSHNLNMDNSYDLPNASNGNRTVLALVVANNTLTVQGDTNTNEGNGLTITHFLELDGTIDLEGESQLIQTEDSDLAVNSSGKVERDQQGTADKFTYNYWSSPVGVSNTTSNNNSYSLADVMRDGTQNINWITNSYDGTDTAPIGIADYWVWKFANQPDDDYSAWQHVRSNGTLQAGEGFTMKGPGTGVISDNQNYVFTGKPNNGDVNLTITTGNDYLVGNPYASAIDAHQFILDNAPIIEGTGATTGTLYFWEHWGGGSHVLQEYQGGYATYNLSGGTPAASYGTNDPDVATGGTPTKRPGRYIPVGQGFFVIAENSGGTINFNNGQRVFQKESSTSVFMRPDEIEDPREQGRSNDWSNGDPRQKIRLGFYSVNQLHRQLLVTVDENATTGKDWGYDAANYDDQMDDMYWMIDGEKYNIQGTNEMESSTVYPLGLHTDIDGENRIAIDQLENISEDVEIYLHDKGLNIYHDLRAGAYEIILPAGEYLDRFEITFETDEALNVEEFDLADFDINYTNDIESIVLTNNQNVEVSQIELINILGQNVFSTTEISTQSRSVFEVKNLSTGTYIIKVKTPEATFAKKVLVR
ncbi:MAG: LamG-like jellyroll fold domain-containing protein [bacterium]